MSRKVSKRKLKAELKEKRKKQIVSLVLAFLMVISLVGIFFGDTSMGAQDFRYEGHRFEMVQNQFGETFFRTRINREDVLFYALPQDALRLRTEGSLAQVINNAQQFTFSTDEDPFLSQPVDEIRFGLLQYANKPSSIASLESNSTLPTITCADATVQHPVFEIIIANQTDIVAHDTGCVQIAVRQIDLRVLRDRFLFTTLGIIEE